MHLIYAHCLAKSCYIYDSIIIVGITLTSRNQKSEHYETKYFNYCVITVTVFSCEC